MADWGGSLNNCPVLYTPPEILVQATVRDRILCKMDPGLNQYCSPYILLCRDPLISLGLCVDLESAQAKQAVGLGPKTMH